MLVKKKNKKSKKTKKNKENNEENNKCESDVESDPNGQCSLPETNDDIIAEDQINNENEEMIELPKEEL